MKFIHIKQILCDDSIIISSFKNQQKTKYQHSWLCKTEVGNDQMDTFKISLRFFWNAIYLSCFIQVTDEYGIKESGLKFNFRKNNMQ